jgi:WS/DGAT/MGAT family acyltransferase
VLWKIHHCIVDGVSWVETLNVMLEPRRDAVAPTPLKPEEPKPLPKTAQRFVDAFFDLTSMQLRALQRIVSGANGRAKVSSPSAPIADAFGPLLRPTVLAPWNEGTVTKSRAMASLRFPLADACAIRKAFGGTINDLALAVLGEGAARYLHQHKCDTRRSRLRIGCPVSVRSDDEIGALGNRVSMMVPELYAAPMDPVARLKAVCGETRRIKSSNAAHTADLMMSAADLIPPAAMGLASSIATRAADSAATFASFAPMVARMMRPRVAAINFIATNVAGPRGPVYLAGHLMLDYVGMIPLGGNVGYSVVITTYDQNLLFGMMAAPDLMPDLETMKFFVAQAFDELALAAKTQLGPEQVIAETAAHPQAA